MSENIRVHLDYLLPRQSIRYVDEVQKEANQIISNSENSSIIYRDLEGDWFKNLRKPDFQRETNAWTPEQCVEFLDSVLNERIIPSIILWHSQDNGCIYVLDGAHRLSVIRAWMTDDWGDKNDKYYDRKDKEELKHAATQTRKLVNLKIGSYKEFISSYSEMLTITDRGGAPKTAMHPKNFEQARFYSRIQRNRTIPAQWENGDYERAEQSFLRINRQGQALDPWEATLIEYRKGSYSRVVMSIANGGKVGHFWPIDNNSKEMQDVINGFQKKCNDIHTKLFVPPFKLPISDLNVPLMVSPAYFQKHKYLLELIPLIINKEIAQEDDKQVDLLKRDVNEDPKKIIENSSIMINKIDDILEQIVSFTHNSKCLAIVPLFYWYNERGQYNRSLLYGFFYWLFAGSEEDLKTKKHIFCAFRDKFEYILQEFKVDISLYLNASSGAGLKSVKQTATFIQNVFRSLISNPTLKIGSEDLDNLALEALNSSSKSRKKIVRNSRNVTNRDKTQVNIRELFKNSIACHICGGIVNLHYGGVQYDHQIDFSIVKETSPDNLKPTHPYCNNNKHRIILIKENKEQIVLPELKFAKEANKNINTGQLSLFWGDDDFPL